MFFFLQSVESLESGSSEGSEEVLSYQEALESVLTWLLEAEDNLHKQADISQDVQVVKQQFHTHEVPYVLLVNILLLHFCWTHSYGVGYSRTFFCLENAFCKKGPLAFAVHPICVTL